MAKIIQFENGRKIINDNLICRKPLEFRRGDWDKGQVLQCLRDEAEKYQSHRRQALTNGHRHIRFVPESFSLVGGSHYTVMGLYRLRQQEKQARELYRLAGLMECVVNSSSPQGESSMLYVSRTTRGFILHKRRPPNSALTNSNEPISTISFTIRGLPR